MPTIAIIGAGPGLGLALARTFGREGFDVALISRSQDKLDRLAAELAADGITAAGFAADVLDRAALRRALLAARDHFGGLDVLEYSPADASAGPLAPVDVRDATPENVQPQIEYYLYGAMTAAGTVLPAMLEAGAGTLLFTTGAGSLFPVAQYGNVTAGGAALRNWALNLGEALSGTGVHIAHVAIGLMIADEAPAPGLDVKPAAEIAPLYLDLHRTRSTHELVVTA